MSESSKSKRLNSYGEIPGRPYDTVSAWYTTQNHAIELSILVSESDEESESDAIWNSIVQYDGTEFTFRRGSRWYKVGQFITGGFTAAQCLCFQVMANTEEGCYNQAVSDTAVYGCEERWQEIIDDVMRIHSVANVICT